MANLVATVLRDEVRHVLVYHSITGSKLAAVASAIAFSQSLSIHPSSRPFSSIPCHQSRTWQMFRSASDSSKLERVFLHKQWSLETCPPEHRQPLTYILHLCSHWRPHGRAKLIVPAQWREYLASQADDKCGTAGVANRGCPLGTVRFESVGMVTLGEELPQEVVLQALTRTNLGTESGCLATLVARAFEGIPCTSSRSDLNAVGLAGSQATPRIDFVLVSDEGASAENVTPCLLFGTKEPSIYPSVPSDARSTLGPLDVWRPISEALTGYGQCHLMRLLKLIRTGGTVGTTVASLPEWLVLFGLLYDTRHVYIVAYVPRRPPSEPDCYAAYVVDQVSLRSGSLASGARTCEWVLERLRLLVALTTLRRHAMHLAKSLLASVADPCSDIGRQTGDRVTCDRRGPAYADSDDSEYTSVASTSEYSTCPSGIHADGAPVAGYGEVSFSSCGSFAHFCSTCSSSSLLESATPSSSSYTEGTDADSGDYMEPPTSSHSRGSSASVGPRLSRLMETRRCDIIAWAQEVIPTEHPVKDTYKMIVNHQLPGR